MVQGTGSDVGKSLLVTGLCRALTRRGIRVRPFKPQNMSNNAAVTADGGEIGRAQALQARACGVAPSVHMNPVLLKPTAEVGAQVVVQGRVTANADARAYHRMKPSLMSPVLESFARLRGEADLVLVEGAGSPAETNLREGDIANMGFALTARVPVVLVADIERGGVLASLVGTHALLEPAERDMVAGYVVNKFRGDPSLFDPAIMEIGGRTGWRCFGVLPFLEAARRLPQEDAMALESAPLVTTGKTAIRIAVPRLARIANFDDLDPLAAEADVRVRILQPGEALPAETDLVLLPGTKATLSDLAYLREQGWDVDILAHHRRGGLVVGLCGGYQMLGRSVADPGGAEGRRARRRAWVCWTSIRCWGATRPCARSKARKRSPARRSAATRCTWEKPPAPAWPGRGFSLPMGARTAPCRRTVGCVAPTCMASLPPTGSAAPSWTACTPDAPPDRPTTSCSRIP